MSKEVLNEKDIESIYLNILKKDYEKYLKNYGIFDSMLNDTDKKVFIHDIIESKNWIEKKIIDIKLGEQLFIQENKKNGIIITRSSFLGTYFIYFILSLLTLYLPIHFDWNIILKILSITFSFFWFLGSLKCLKKIIFFNDFINEPIINQKDMKLTPYEKWKDSIEYDENGKIKTPFGNKK